MSDTLRSPSGLWRATGASDALFKHTRERFAEDLAAKDRLYRWDLSAESQAMIVRLAMLACADVVGEYRHAWLNSTATAADHEAPTRETAVAPRTITRTFEKP